MPGTCASQFEAVRAVPVQELVPPMRSVSAGHFASVGTGACVLGHQQGVGEMGNEGFTAAHRAVAASRAESARKGGEAKRTAKDAVAGRPNEIHRCLNSCR